jgi:hypothetical protein
MNAINNTEAAVGLDISEDGVTAKIKEIIFIHVIRTIHSTCTRKRRKI